MTPQWKELLEAEVLSNPVSPFQVWILRGKLIPNPSTFLGMGPEDKVQSGMTIPGLDFQGMICFALQLFKF